MPLDIRHCDMVDWRPEGSGIITQAEECHQKLVEFGQLILALKTQDSAIEYIETPYRDCGWIESFLLDVKRGNPRLTIRFRPEFLGEEIAKSRGWVFEFFEPSVIVLTTAEALAIVKERGCLK